MAKELKSQSKSAVLPPIKSDQPAADQTKAQPTDQTNIHQPATNESNSQTGSPTTPLSSSENSAQGTTTIVIPSETIVPTTKDVMIGAGALLVLAILFFFIRGTFENYLVGSLRRSPSSAGMAGWGLFGGLFFGAALGCVALVSKVYMTIPLIVALSALSIICFLLSVIVASKK